MRAILDREKAEKANDVHWHRMGERCWCGFLSVPSRFFEYKDNVQTNTQEEAEASYLAWLASSGKPDWVNPPILAELSLQDHSAGAVPTSVPTCDECGIKPREGRYKVCSACRKKRQRAD